MPRRCIEIMGGLLVLAVPVHAQTIGLYFDEARQVCSRQVTSFDQGRLWVVASFDDVGGPPIAGAHFRIAGLPEGWTYTEGFYQVGADGMRFADEFVMGFQNPPPREHAVLLVAIDFFTNGFVVPETVLRIEGPAGAPGPSPILVRLEDAVGCAGIRTSRYVLETAASGQEAVLNGPCTVSVEKATWERVKGLYR